MRILKKKCSYKFFFTVLKIKTQLSEGRSAGQNGSFCGGNFDIHVNRANQQFNTFIDM